MPSRIFLFPIKEGKRQLLSSWLTLLNSSRRTEAEASLVRENVTRELASIFTLYGSDYLLGIMIADGEILPADPSLSINREHRAMLKECLEISQKLELPIFSEISGPNG